MNKLGHLNPQSKLFGELYHEMNTPKIFAAKKNKN